MVQSKNLATYPLTDGWTFKQADDEVQGNWMPVKKVPTNVHLDLIDNGKYVLRQLTIPSRPKLMINKNPGPLPWFQRAQGGVGSRQGMVVQSPAA